MKQLKIYAVLSALLVIALAIFWRSRSSDKPNPAAAPPPTVAQPAAPTPPPAKLVTAPPPAPATNSAPTQLTAAKPEPLFLPVLAKFTDWVTQYTNGGTVSLAEGESLAQARRSAMVYLIKNDPRKAFEWTVPAGWRTKLPASITQHFEKRVDALGSLNVAVATDFDQNTTKVVRDVQIGGKIYDAHIYGPRRQSQPSQPSIPIHGIAIGTQLAVHEDPVRILEPEEVVAAEQSGLVSSDEICGVSGKPSNYRNQQVTADIGGQIIHLCGVDHAKLVNQRLTAAEGGSGTIPGGTGAGVVGWTQGPKNVLYMRVNFPDDLSEPISETGAYATMDSVNAFYVEGSYNTTALTPTVTPLLTLPNSKAWYSTAGALSLLTDARNVARAAGYDTANYDRDIVAFTSVPGFDFGGLAYVGGKGVWLQSTGVGVTSHELGHNYGLWHANFWDTSTTNGDSIIGPGAHIEYGNIYDTMGNATAGNNQFNAMHKNILDWLPDLYVHDIKSNGVYRIYAFDIPSRTEGQFYSAKIRKDFQRDYWLEFRQKFKSNPWLQNGILLDWSPWSESSGGTHLLDTTPGTPTGSGSREDAAVVIGRTYTDAPAGVHITPVARGQTGTNPWIDVQVNLGTFPSNEPPVLAIEMDTNNAAAGQLVHFHATASDPNGDTLAYAWSFDDLKFSTNNLPWTVQSWSKPGEHVVRCVVSDMKGGIASANAVVTIGTPLGYRVSGLVIDTNGVPIEGVRVDTTLTNGAYFGGYTDSDGRYVIVGVTNDLNLYALKYGYSFTNITWTNPITAGSNNFDFIATPVQAVSIAATTNAISERDGSQQYFTLTRTGDISTNLLVNLYLSGSATLDSDYTLSPDQSITNALPLQSGTNVVEFPPGSNQLQFAFHVINDSTVEGPETVTFSILEDTNYVNASLSEATVTILDDDNTPLPKVSVAANASSGGDTVIESDLNGGVFTFTRNGSTQNDLTVNYAVSGTATPGVDYQTLLGVVIIPAGSSTATVNLRTIDDTLVESNETVRVTISANAAYSVAGNPATITIVDNDFSTVTVYPTGTAAEPSTSGRFTVMRTGDLTDNLVVNYTVSGTATSGVDYTALGGTVTIPAGRTSADISVSPLSDNLLEGDESVIVTLASNTNYSVGTPGTATVFIRDAQKPTLTISALDDTASEPGIDTGQFIISRGSVVNGDLTVNLAISGSAVNGSDYVPIDNTIVIPDGSSSVTIDVIPFDDLHFETNETVIITFAPGANYNFSSQQSAQVTILDDDTYNLPSVGFSFPTSSAPESSSPGVSVTLSMTSAVPVTVNYIRIGGTAPSSRYDLGPGTLTFNPGEQAISIPLQIINNTTVEPNQTIRLALVDPSNAAIDAIKVHTYTILDDDSSTISVTATAPTASETGTPGNFRFSRVGGTNAQVVNFQVTGTASAPTDYAPIGNSVTIPAGANFVDVPVVPMNDAPVELGETVVVTLTSAPGASLADPKVAIVTITDNDTNTLPVVSVSSTNKPYAVEGAGKNGEFVFTRTGSIATALSVNFTVTGTASNGVDYTTLPNVITIPAGQTSFTLPVVPLTDNSVEGEETVIVTLTDNSTYRVLYPSSATVIIQDNEQSVRLEATDFAASKTGPDLGEFTFSRFGTTNTDLKVFYAISGTASNGVDYLAITNFIIIPVGQLTNTLPIIPHADYVPKGPVTVTLTLLPDPAYKISSPTAGTVVIDDNMPMLELVGTATDASENGEKPGVITIRRRGDPEIDFTAYVTIGGTATFGVDYPAFQTNVLFCCGVTSIDLTISPTNDLLVEGPETVAATLQPNPATYTIIGASNTVVNIEDVGTNQFPVVNLTSPTTNIVFLTMPGTNNVGMLLEATVTDDGDTNALTYTWTNLTRLDTYSFENTNAVSTAVTFSNNGVYVLQLTVDDGQLRSRTNVTVVVNADTTLAPDLLYWTLNDGSGTNAVDTSGSGRNGVVFGTTNWVTNGAAGGALGFGGTNAFVTEATNSHFLNGQKALTLSMWIKSATTNSDRGFISANDSGGTNTTFGLRSKSFDARSHGTNVIEATIPGKKGAARYVSASNVTTNEWQHLALTWTNGSPPVLFINGRQDTPTFPPLIGAGLLTNCLQFIAGKGPADGSNSWNGLLDDIRLYSRPLSAGEVAILAAMPPANLAPVIDAGPDLTVQINLPVEIDATAVDDGKPNPPGVLSNYWSVITTNPVVVTDPNSLTNTFVFQTLGTNIIRLISDDGQVKVFDDVIVNVTEPTSIYLYATDPDAAEFGPDEGQFTIQRYGDTSFPLNIYLEYSGIASNGVDCVLLTNIVTIPTGSDTVTLTVRPFLDDRTEGDEPLIANVVSNVAYTIVSGQATVTIHDSPYGVWTIAHFSLEELTFPLISGATADFDHDGLISIGEYALNLDPKSGETNAPVATAIEVDPRDGKPHITVTYHRRLQPIDVLYGVFVSNDLLSWNTGTDYLEELQVTNDGNNLTETVKLQVVAPYSTTTNQFINLRVWQPQQ